MRLPTVIASSVIRSTHQGESHGGLYAVNLETERVRQVLDWDHLDIRWDGRGGERGLRGVAVHQGAVYVASYDRLYEMDTTFAIRESYTNRYLRDCHEISACDGRLFVASTGTDSVLEFDLLRRSFVRGYHLRYGGARRLLNKVVKRSRVSPYRPAPDVHAFEASSPDGPPPRDRLHLNAAFGVNGGVVVSGSRLGVMVEVQDGKGRKGARIPYETHNARPYRAGVIVNDTSRDRIVYLERGRVRRVWRIPRYDPGDLENAHLPRDYARQAFGRGLCVLPDERIVAGSSPATVSVYEWERPDPVKVIRLSRDVRNAIHGLAIWRAGRPTP